MFTQLALLLLTHYHFSRGESLLMLLRLFTGDAQHYDIPSIEAYKEQVLLLGAEDTVFPPLLPLYSTVRNRGALRAHVMLCLLMRYHLPGLAFHLDRLDKNWWYPTCYNIEKEDDFITVSSLTLLDHRMQTVKRTPTTCYSNRRALFRRAGFSAGFSVRRFAIPQTYGTPILPRSAWSRA